MKLPDFTYERNLVQRGISIIAGADEVGRGSFAGPVVAAAVVFNSQDSYSHYESSLIKRHIVVNDSKKLSPKQREFADEWIRQEAFVYGIGEGSVREINKLGIVGATQKAYRRAISEILRKLPTLKIEHLLVDAFYVPHLKGLTKKKNQTAIIKGDGISFSIAAASIIAKVYRDNLMRNLGSSLKYKKYGWEQNKGYGTFEHRKAIQNFGSSVYHREKFIQGINDSFFSQGQSDV